MVCAVLSMLRQQHGRVAGASSQCGGLKSAAVVLALPLVICMSSALYVDDFFNTCHTKLVWRDSQHVRLKLPRKHACRVQDGGRLGV